MWNCSRCHETIEDTFEACWSCGAGADGTVDPAFQPEPIDPSIPNPGPSHHVELPKPRDNPFPAFRFSLQSFFLFFTSIAVILGASLAAPDFIAASILVPFSVAAPVWTIFRLKRNGNHPYTRAFYLGAFVPALLVAVGTLVVLFIALFRIDLILPPDIPAELIPGPLQRVANVSRVTGLLMLVFAGACGVLCFVFRWLVEICNNRP